MKETWQEIEGFLGVTVSDLGLARTQTSTNAKNVFTEALRANGFEPNGHASNFASRGEQADSVLAHEKRPLVKTAPTSTT